MSDIPDGWTVVRPAASSVPSELPDGWSVVKAAPKAATPDVPEGNTTIVMQDGLPTRVPKGPATPEPSPFEKVNAGVEAGANTAAGLLGGAAGMIAAPFADNPQNYEENVGKIGDSIASPLYDRSTPLGQKYTDWINENIMPSLPALAGLGHSEGPASQVGRALEDVKAKGRLATERAYQGPQIPEGWTVVKPAEPAPTMQVTPEGQAFTPTPEINLARQNAEAQQAAAQAVLDRANAENVQERPANSTPLVGAQFGGKTAEEPMPAPTETQTIAQNTPEVNDLGNAIQEANGPKLGPDETYGAGNLSGPMGAPELPVTGTPRFPRGQRGAVDIQEVADGLKALVDGKVVGYLKDNLPRGMAAKIGENANVDIVHLDPAYRGLGIGQKLYEAFSDRHDGNIMPSGKTSPSAWKLWNRNYPDKVTAFVQQEAGRIADGAPVEQVLSNITDPGVRRQVVEQANPLKALDIPRSQRGAIDLDAVKEGLANLRGMRVETPDGVGRVVSHRVELVKDFDKIADHLDHLQNTIHDEDAMRAAQDHFIENEQHTIPNDKPVGKYTVQMPDGSQKTYFGDELGKVFSGLTPVGQRGGIDVNAIGDALKRMVNMIDPPRIQGVERPSFHKEPADIIKRATGIDSIPKDPTYEEIKAGVMKEGVEDGKMMLPSMRAGALMAGDQRGSSLIQGAGRLVMNGVKRANLNIQRIVHPVEQRLARLVSKDVVGLASVFKDEMFNGMQHSDEQLTKRGLTPHQIDVYHGIRDMFTKALNSMNEARTAMGMKPVSAQEGYLSSRWGGRFRIPVYAKDGKLVWYIADQSKRSALKALDYLRKSGTVDVDLAKTKLETRGTNSMYSKDTRGALEDSYLTMLSQLDKDDPRVQNVKSIMEDAMATHGYDTLGQAKHFQPKANIRGFLGDRPWLGAAKDAYDMFKSQTDYAKNAFQWAESQKAVQTIKQLLADKDVQNLQPHNAEFVRQYTKNHLGFGEHPIISAIEKWMSEKVGYDRNIASQNLGVAKAIFLTQKLAMNLGYYASQALQSLNSIPEHALYSSRGYKHNLLTTIARSQQDFAAGTIDHTMDVLSRGKVKTNLPMTHLGQAAWDYMEANGVSNRNIFDEASGLGRHPLVENATHVLGAGIAAAEQILRTNTFLQFAHHFDQSGMFKSRSAMFQEAEEATSRAMVDFRREERASVFSKLGIVGSAASTLKSYLINYYNNMGRYGQAALKGNPRALLYALGVQGLVYGVLNMPGENELSDGWDLLKKHLSDAAFNMVKDVNIKKGLIDLMGDWSYGGISKLTGANLGNRGNVGIDSSFSLDGMFPFLTDQYKQAKAMAGVATNPNATTAAQAAYAVAPSGFPQGNVAMSEPFQAGQRPDGTTVFQKPSKLTEHEFDYARTPAQITMKKWGFTPVEESRIKDLTFAVNQDESNLRDRRQDNINKAFDALVRHDPADFTKAKDYFVAFHGDPDDFVNGLITEAFKQKISREQILAIKGNPSTTSLQKLQQLKQLIGRIQ